MTDVTAGHPLPRPERLDLPEDLLLAMRAAIGPLSDEAVAAIMAEIPSYADLRGGQDRVVRGAVALALGNFLTLAARQADPATPIVQSTSGAYDLGRGEARSGRSMDALLMAYRIGARVSWRGLSSVALTGGMSADSMGAFAELVFAYIDELSAASVAGHTDQLETSGRVRERYLELLARALLAGAPEPELRVAAERAAWEPPEHLTAVILPESVVPGVLTHLDPRTLHVVDESPSDTGEPGQDRADDDRAVLLVPGSGAAMRERLIRLLDRRSATVGPTVPWPAAEVSMRRATAGLSLPRTSTQTVDTDGRLVELVLRADPDALADLRTRALAPLAELRESQRVVLEETLRAWLLHQGRRQDVADALHVHPQTVRYRMGRIRAAFGERLDDPDAVLQLVLALGPA